MGLVVLPKTLVAHTDAVAADVMADLNAIVAKVNGELTLENLASSIRQALAEPGDIKASGRAAAPSGWLLCEGQAVSRAAFSALFAAIGTAYGAGDGSTTFNVPDLRGRFPIGVDAGAGRNSAFNGRGQSSGSQLLRSHRHHTTANTGGESSGHQHALPMFFSVRHETAGTAWSAWNAGAVGESSGFNNVGHVHLLDADTSVTGSGPEDGLQMPPFQNVNYMVKT